MVHIPAAAGWTAGYVGAVILTVWALVEAVPKVWRFIRAAARVPFVIEGVSREFSPNGGSSMHDSINHIQTSIDQIRTWQVSHLARDDRFEEYVHDRFHGILNELTTAIGVKTLLSQLDAQRVGENAQQEDK